MTSNTNRAIAAFLADQVLDNSGPFYEQATKDANARILEVMGNSRAACDVLEWAEVLELVERAEEYTWPDWKNDDAQADDFINEIADSAVSIYNAERYEWAAKHGRADYTEAMDIATKDSEPHNVIAYAWVMTNANALRSILPAICKVYANE